MRFRGILKDPDGETELRGGHKLPEKRRRTTIEERSVERDSLLPALTSEDEASDDNDCDEDVDSGSTFGSFDY